MSSPAPEFFVPAETIAEFLSMPRATILRLAREGVIPGHAFNLGERRQWRFRLSEVAKALESGNNGHGSACDTQ